MKTIREKIDNAIIHTSSNFLKPIKIGLNWNEFKQFIEEINPFEKINHDNKIIDFTGSITYIYLMWEVEIFAFVAFKDRPAYIVAQNTYLTNRIFELDEQFTEITNEM